MLAICAVVAVVLGVLVWRTDQPTEVSAADRAAAMAGAASQTVAAPDPRPLNVANQRVLFLGDSFTEGTGANPLTRGYAYLAGEQLGGDFVVSGHSGSGYVKQGPKDGLTFGQALDTLPATPAPTLVIVQGSINDQEVTGALYQNADSLISRVRAKWPGVQLAMFGPIAGDPSNEPSVNAIQNVDTILQSAAAARSIAYISAEGLDPWVTTSNAAQLISRDKVHPSPAGHQDIADRLVQALRTQAGTATTAPAASTSTPAPAGAGTSSR
ncbi:Lysophospholipase L1 [Williamsia serinedens]|uniref:Lysophospholipase L1 n=1 Tax=Williamsia serinedens TaxID=391736 RepID=A0ABT1H7D7_9NOCA|nr:Lysophospholipase L1 [Williamsia serinedens]